MKLPFAENAVVDAEKVRDYLLSRLHPVGRFKAVFFAGLGYTQENWANCTRTCFGSESRARRYRESSVASGTSTRFLLS
jgi:hypothetical protein